MFKLWNNNWDYSAKNAIFLRFWSGNLIRLIQNWKSNEEMSGLSKEKTSIIPLGASGNLSRCVSFFCIVEDTREC